MADPDILIALAGNKVDLVAGNSSTRSVDFTLGASLAAEKQLLFYEISAKSGSNVGELFTDIGELFGELLIDLS